MEDTARVLLYLGSLGQETWSELTLIFQQLGLLLLSGAGKNVLGTQALDVSWYTLTWFLQQPQPEKNSDLQSAEGMSPS